MLLQQSNIISQLIEIIKKYNLSKENIKEEDFFKKNILNESKGKLKLLSLGKLDSVINIEVSYASKKAIEKVEKLGGSVKITETSKN